MFKLLNNNKGQGATVQYALTFFFVVVAVTGMTVYFKRTIQGRIRDATFSMARTVSNVYNGRIVSQYEPYYITASGDRLLTNDKAQAMLASFNSTAGIYMQNGTTVTKATSYSDQAPPVLGD